MSAIVSPAHRPFQRAQEGDLPIDFPAPANDEIYSELGAVFGPEEELCVHFTGIGAAESRKALASFPGGRRFALQG